MEFVDVVFPLNLDPLTYKCPEHLSDKALPGMLVSAPLKKQTAKGIIIGKSSSTARYTLNALRSVSDIHGEAPLLEPSMIKLLDWMSGYYIANKGIILKNMLPKEAFKRVKARKTQLSDFSSGLSAEVLKQQNGVDRNILSRINESIAKKEYRTFLFHAPTSSYEVSLVSELIRQERKVIVLVPEIVHIENIAPFIREIVGEKLCILHSGLSRGQRSDAFERILSGECTVVLGTRMAIFAPLKNVSIIAVMQEHSSSYKTEEGLRYNARDVAVMRGCLEGATVLLSSICPSIESIYNTRQNKYVLLKPDAPVRRPGIKIVNMVREKHLVTNLSKTVIDAIQSSIKRNESAILVINRKGYSMLTCRECGYTETCDRCGIPLVFHKDDRSLRCHYCGFKSPSPEKCKRCRGFDIELAGAGIQRVEENLKKIFGLEPIRIDSDRIRGRAVCGGLSDMIRGERIIIGTRLLTKRLAGGEFDMAAVLDADSYLNHPDFRSAEKAYQELSIIADRIKPGGTLFVQTRMPQNYLFKFIKSHNYYGFCREELLKRKSVSYPPYSKMALVMFKGKDHGDKIREVINKSLESADDVDVLGPSLSLTGRGQKEYRLLLKAASGKKLHSYVKGLLRFFEGFKDLKVDVAIDP